MLSERYSEGIEGAGRLKRCLPAARVLGGAVGHGARYFERFRGWWRGGGLWLLLSESSACVCGGSWAT